MRIGSLMLLTVLLGCVTLLCLWLGHEPRIGGISPSDLDAADLIPGFLYQCAPVAGMLTGIGAITCAVLIAFEGAEGAAGIATFFVIIAVLGFVPLGQRLAAAWSSSRPRPPRVAIRTPPPPPPTPPPTPTLVPLPAGFQPYADPTGLFHLGVPSSWVVKPGQGAQVFFDGTKPAGAFSFGDDLLVTWLTADSDDSRDYDEACGSHVCGATLTLVRHRHLQLKLRHYWDPDSGPRDGVVEKDLGALGEKIAPTIR